MFCSFDLHSTFSIDSLPNKAFKFVKYYENIIICFQHCFNDLIVFQYNFNKKLCSEFYNIWELWIMYTQENLIKIFYTFCRFFPFRYHHRIHTAFGSTVIQLKIQWCSQSKNICMSKCGFARLFNTNLTGRFPWNFHFKFHVFYSYSRFQHVDATEEVTSKVECGLYFY